MIFVVNNYIDLISII